MERHARTIVVGAFVLLTIGGLFWFNHWISAGGISAQTTTHQIAIRGAVSGLSVGSEVRYLGVLVGRVSAITLSATKLGEVNVDFESDQLIPADKVLAQLEPQGITGLSVIELRLQSQADPGFLTDAGVIPGYPSLVTQLSAPASNIAGSVDSVMGKVENFMNDETMANLAESIKQLNYTTAKLASASDGLANLMQSVTQVTLELEDTIPTYRQVGVTLETQLLPAVQQVAIEFRNTAATANTILRKNGKDIDRLFEHDIPNIVGLTDELAQSLRSITELASGLNNEPTRLIYGKRVPELEISSE
ncbi:MAG: phospholipid/cholesterol/gamma-HCH transport system substrate-binding protein [Gammaproteobacteria bacterium]|jgi:phospholipid/cholesterol/gamma-HCH transport system substrate-binding protein